MRMRIYNFLVNRHSGIAFRYHKFHDKKLSGLGKILSWIYLLWLNFCYYFLFLRYLDRLPELKAYESKRLPIRESESERDFKRRPDAMRFAENLMLYDVISFDVFDTLLFRPFENPTDLFYLIGGRLDILNFKNPRVQAEQAARERRFKAFGDREVTLDEIWRELENEVGNGVRGGIKLEREIEYSLCYANPYMKKVWEYLKASGKRIILTTDMYLSSRDIQKILEKAGFQGYEDIFVSCEYRKSKATGELFDIVRKTIGNVNAVHVGDHPYSDGIMARKAGFHTCLYPRTDRYMTRYRPFDLSPIVGSAYRGIVSARVYNGSRAYSPLYEFGYLYGGLFVTGYCRFIHDYCHTHKIDKILFLSRDGDTLQKAYAILYPGEETVYARWSRKAAVKLMAGEDKHDYFRRFLDHKSGQGIKIREILRSMDLEFLIPELEAELKFNRENSAVSGPDEILTGRNLENIRQFLLARFEKILNAYDAENNAAKKYYLDILSGCRHAAAVDIGWAGSGAIALSHLTEKVWKIPCRITGIIAGTNTPYNAEPDASEAFLQNGRLVAYLYSQRHNRDLLKKHDPNRDYNIYWELLLSSTDPPLNGFAFDETGNAIPRFGEPEPNADGIREIQRGILDFVEEYHTLFRDFPEMTDISGRDAYAPMIAAASYGERYLKAPRAMFQPAVTLE